jgi:hypothetical protein
VLITARTGNGTYCLFIFLPHFLLRGADLICTHDTISGGAYAMSMIRNDPSDGYWWTIGSSPSYLLQPLLMPGANFNASSFKSVCSLYQREVVAATD